MALAAFLFRRASSYGSESPNGGTDVLGDLPFLKNLSLQIGNFGRFFGLIISRFGFALAIIFSSSDVIRPGAFCFGCFAAFAAAAAEMLLISSFAGGVARCWRRPAQVVRTRAATVKRRERRRLAARSSAAHLLQGADLFDCCVVEQCVRHRCVLQVMKRRLIRGIT